jgi:hypothetical protein
MSEESQLNDENFNAVLRIYTPYIAEVVDQKTKAWDGVSQEQIDELVGEVLGSTIELTEQLAQFDQGKIKRVDELAENGDFELAHRVLFNEKE